MHNLGRKLIFLFCSILLAFILLNCSRKDEQKIETDKKDVSNTSDNKKDSIQSTDTYFYEPDTCSIYGLLNKELFYGPPGYGQTPKKDTKENCYVLRLAKPVTVKPTTGSDKDIDIPQSNLLMIQIYSNDEKINNFLEGRIGERIMVRGRFMGAVTGHHHTPVIMEVLEYKYYGS